ncbi:cytochrome c maturation protein CcmE [Salmonella enterica subsp. enterica]|nr:cytochrome c maturation protein CcmE [Salmonella enterica subsp. enterica]
MGGLRGAGGLGLTTATVTVRAAREYRPVLYPRRNPLRQARDAAAAAAGRRLRVGGMVMPGSVRRDPDSLKVNFYSLYDRRAVTVI